MERGMVLVCTLTLAAVVVVPREASAIKLVIYQSGEDVFESGPLPAPFSAQPKLANVKAGYICKVFGIFWAYLHTWSCRPIAFQGTTVYTDKTLVAAIAGTYPPSTMKIGLWAKHGRWVFAAIILVLIVGAVSGKKKKAEE
jgi:hypothetical protein